MFRRLVLAGVVVVLGVGVAVQPAAAIPQQTDNGTAFEVRAASDEIPLGGNGTELYVSGLPVGTPIEITATGIGSPTLGSMIDGDPTANGVRTTVPANGTIPVANPPILGSGDYEFTVQRLDTGTTTRASITVTHEGGFTADFARDTYTGTPESVVPVDITTNYDRATLQLVDPNSDYRASVTVDDEDRTHTVWIDTSAPTNASELFTTELDAEATDRKRTGYLPELNGTYRLRLDPRVYGNRSNAANLTISSDGRARPTADEGQISAEALSDEFSTNDPGNWAFVRVDGVPDGVPVTAALNNPPTGYSQATLGAMLRGEQVGDDIRTIPYENGTIELSAIPAIRCLGADLSIEVQRLDTGQTATAEIATTYHSSVTGVIHRENYTVASGSVLPITLTRDCNELTLELTRVGSNASASIGLADDAPIERNETLWLDTAGAGNASGLFRSAVGTVTRNATTNFSDGALAPGTYRLQLTYGRYELDTATLSVTNQSSEQSPSGPMPDPPETPPSTPNTIVPPPATDTSTPDQTTGDRTVTEPSSSNRTAEGNAHRPAGTEPFGTTAATTDGSGPGFGPVIAALALAALSMLAARRNDD
ncbi:hypothetical protein BV210_07440 [Halorientalis sp. IM1011]|uniref:hypothetical protein n=1 Tax=Halorientalis sp. IM1011 TaxID=1932360 RepID=UPI00097CC639|nr:hypothetical protein [Halorientalis sp. IM1011]AQL42553.1 hypothetical protein BV210_07440 [Halorientalis sp. IM1011]